MSFSIKRVMSIANSMEHIIGYILILYGCSKIVICVIKALPKHIREKWFPLIKRDPTTAGVVLDIVLFCFGIFAVLRGLSLAKHLHPAHADVLTSIHIVVYMYTLFGLFLVSFYYIILYTNFPLSKDTNERITYELFGLGAGLTFLISMCVMLAWNIYHNNIDLRLVSHSQEHNILFLLAIAFILTYMNIMIIMNVIKERQQKNDNSIQSALIDLTFLPLGAVI